jgi:hypothetical protein
VFSASLEGALIHVHYQTLFLVFAVAVVAEEEVEVILRKGRLTAAPLPQQLNALSIVVSQLMLARLRQLVHRRLAIQTYQHAQLQQRPLHRQKLTMNALWHLHLKRLMLMM